LLLLALLSELFLELLHVIEEPVMTPLPLLFLLLLLILIFLRLLLVLLLLLDLELIQLLLQQLLSDFQLLAFFYSGLVLLFLLFDAVTDKFVGRWTLLAALAQTLESGLTLFYCLEYFLQGIGGLKGFCSDIGS